MYVAAMKVQRLYIDTSVVGGCHDDEFAPWSTGLLKDFRLGNFKPVVSEVVDAEIQDAPEPVQETYYELLAGDHEFIHLTEEAQQLATIYLERDILSANYFDDALHIALATIVEVDVLVSWNFRHIVHFDKIRRFNGVNLELGYKQIQIYSPREVTNYGPEKGI